MADLPISNNLADSPYRSKNCCGLLVSVRDAQEAQLCLRHGVDILDLKEPLAGALGTVSDLTIEQVQQLAMEVTSEQRPKLSFALGELADWDFKSYPRLLDRYGSSQIAEMSYVKIGLAGAQQLEDWQARWCELFRGLSESTEPVLVGYLDRLPEASQGWTNQAEDEGLANNRCPSIEQLIDFAKTQPKVSTILLDTCDKQNDLFASVDDQRLQEIIAAASNVDLVCVVAGSIDVDSLPRVLRAGASLVGVRGAVCDGDRSGTLCEQKLVEFRGRIAGSIQAHAEGLSAGLASRREHK